MLLSINNLPTDLSSIAVHFTWYKSKPETHDGKHRKCSLFSSKMESFIWVRVVCFGQCWWEMSFPSETIPAHSKLWVWKMAQAQWQTHFSSPIWDLRQGDVSFAVISFNDMFFRKPRFLTYLCVEVSRGQKKNYVKEKIKDDTIIHYIYTHEKKACLSEKQERSTNPEKNSQWNRQAIWQHK